MASYMVVCLSNGELHAYCVASKPQLNVTLYDLSVTGVDNIAAYEIIDPAHLEPLPLVSRTVEYLP